MRYLIAIALLCLPLAGCGSMMVGQTRAELLEADRSQCADYGFRRGTDAYADCMMQQDQDRQARADRARRALGKTLAQVGQNMSRPTTRPVTCTTHPGMYLGNGMWGNSTTTCM